MRSQPLGNLSSHWTIELGKQRFYIILGLFTLFHFWMAAQLPPVEDELYYWAWSKKLQWSYYDHPLWVAYLIRFSTTLFGDTLFGIRFFAVLTSTAVLILLARRGHLYRPFPIWACLAATPLFLWGSVLMTPDVPLVFFWTLYLLWAMAMNRILSRWSLDPITRAYRSSPVPYALWALGGLIFGLGLLGKYTMGLALPCIFLVLVTHYPLRAWWKGLLLHCAIAAVASLPIVIYNAQHDWASFRFQFYNALAGSTWEFARFSEFIGSQLILVGALPFLWFPVVLLRQHQLRQDPDRHVCFFFFMVPLLFFFYQSFKIKIEANWGIVIYLSFWPLAQRLVELSSFRNITKGILVAAFAPAFVFSVMIGLHLFTPWKFMAPTHDRLARFKAQYELSAAVAEELKHHARLPVFAHNYQWTAYLRFQGVAANQVVPGGRESHFSQHAPSPCKDDSVYIFTAESDIPVLVPGLQCMTKAITVKAFTPIVRGEPTGRFLLLRYFK